MPLNLSEQSTNVDNVPSSLTLTVILKSEHLYTHGFLLFQSFKGSFLKHNKTTLSRLSSLTSNTPNASATTRGFVFQTVSPSGKNTINAKVIIGAVVRVLSTSCNVQNLLFSR